MSGPPLRAGLRIGQSGPASLLAVGGLSRERPGIGAPTAPESRGRVRGLASAAGAGLARSRGGAAGDGGDGGGWRWGGGGDYGSRGWGIGSFWILYPGF